MSIRNVELGGKVCPLIFRENHSDPLYRAILISEFKSKMLPRVELKLSTTVRISYPTEVFVLILCLTQI